RVRRLSPGSMLPDHLQVTEIKGGILSIGNIRFASFVHENATRGTDAPGPAEIEHPADHVEHMNAHVADDAVAVFHESPPASGVTELVVRTQRGRAGPHFVIEVI